VETRDPKTGDIVRYNADDDATTLADMMRQERFGAGSADQKDFDGQLAKAIMGDGKFEVRCLLFGSSSLRPWCLLDRTTWNIWMTTPRNLVARRCDRMP
jgi:hypothetical protein